MRIQIIPDTNIENKNNDQFFNNIHHYLPPFKRMTLTKESLTIGDQMSIAFETELTNEVKFFMYFDDRMKDSVMSELNINYPKATFQPVKEKLKIANPAIVLLNSDRHHFLSLKIDKRGLAPLPGILETMKLMQGDKVFIQTVIEPESYDWYRTVEGAIKDFQNGTVAKKIRLDRRSVQDGALKLAVGALEETLSVVSFLISNEELKFDPIFDSEYDDLRRRGLSQNTLTKSKWNGYNTQIRILVECQDDIRRESIIRSIVTSYRSLNEDNRIADIRVKKPDKFLPHVHSRHIPWNINKMILSSAEIGQLCQIPTKAYQQLYNVPCVDTREIEIPEELFKGDIEIGKTVYRGNAKTVFWPSDRNILSLPKIVLGSMGSGKSEYTVRYAVEASRKGDSIVAMDFIKDCELSEKISRYVDSIKINLSDEKSLMAMAYPEMQPTGSEWNKLKAANILARQVEYLLNSLVPDPLTPRMARYLDAASKAVFIYPGAKIMDVLSCLTNWQTRNEYIRQAKYSGCFKDNDPELLDLESLHERDGNGKIVGTRENLIDGIIDRISILQKDLYLRTMLKAEIDTTQNFCQWMNEGKAIMIQIPESTFTNKQTKDALVTFFMSRIWLAALQRKSTRICHVITDEIHQVPTAASLISHTITEARKYGISYYFTIHYLKQFRQLHDAVRSAGCSYMLLAGTEKENLRALEDELQPFTMQEGLALKPFHSLNLINYGNQYARFISKLPGMLR